MINEISLSWQVSKQNSLEKNIEDAMTAWNRRSDTKDVVPEYITFSLKVEEEYKLKYGVTINGMLLRYSKYVQPNQFTISGVD